MGNGDGPLFPFLPQALPRKTDLPGPAARSRQLWSEGFAIIEHEMSKAVGPRTRSGRKVRRKDARIAVPTRRPRSKAEDRLDGMAALKALKESAERIPYQEARRDLDL
jgi:hypothetical protein